MTIRRTGILLLAVLVTGCGFFSRAKKQFYSLDPIPPTAARATVGGTPIGIDGIQLPPGLDRREVVLRGESHRVQIRGTDLWTAPLEEMVTHTLSFDLAHRLPTGMVILPGQAKPGAMRSIYVTFEDLAPGPDRVFVLDARWTLTETGRPELTRHERIAIDLPSLESEQIVAGMSQALAQLADRIAAAL